MTKSKLDRALEVAASVHRLQLRKGTGLPYIVHPVSVMLTASKVTDDEDTLCACLLHDVLEDGDPKLYNARDMTRDFGAAVTATVQDVSKNEAIEGWRERNVAYMDHLERSHNQAAFIVCAADKIHNLQSVLSDHAEVGDELWGRFHAGKDQQKWWYRSTLTLLQAKLPGNPLISELAGLVAELEEL